MKLYNKGILDVPDHRDHNTNHVTQVNGLLEEGEAEHKN